MPRKGNCVANLETSSPSPTIMLPSTSMVNSILEQFGQLPANCSFMVRYLLSHPNAEGRYILSERFSQDPLKNYFGNCRGQREAEMTTQLQSNALTMFLPSGSLALDPVRGNCRRKRRLFPTHPQIDNTPLPKRRKLNIVLHGIVHS